MDRIPDEEEMKSLRDYTVARIDDVISVAEETMDSTYYVELRNLTASRLTLFNGRRGGEATRLKIEHWLKRKQWIKKDQREALDEDERSFFTDIEIMFSTGE